MPAVRRSALIAGLACIGLAGCEPPIPPSEQTPEEVHRNACLLCHAGNGSGAMASDLTTLTAANGGTFPRDMVIRIIDGRDDVRAHGSPMPLWGENHSREDVEALVDYLATIQQ